MSTKLPADLQAQIEAHIGAFNAQDHERFLGVFGDTAIIIDGIAPYRWLNPNAPANWLAGTLAYTFANGDSVCKIEAQPGSAPRNAVPTICLTNC